jgi:MoaD family protein
MPITLKFIGALRKYSGKTQLSVNISEDTSLKALLTKLKHEKPELKKIFGDQELNDSQSNALILINGREISVLNGLKSKVTDGDEIIFVPVVHGG